MQIIPKKTPRVETHWQKELANAFIDIETLLEYLKIPVHSLHNSDGPTRNNLINIVEQHGLARKLFPMRVPRPFAELMETGNWHDPLLQQVVPQRAEFIEKAGFIEDPLAEQNGKTSSVIHKYQSRLLLVVRGGCAVNCRYCFRRHFPYQDNKLNQSQYDSVLRYIEQDKSLNEVIFSGGDPLMANDQQLAKLASQIDALSHIKRLRIHTRLPVVIPSRINKEFIAWASQLKMQLILVLHINHAKELSPALKEKMGMLKNAGITLLNQSVLLKNINDSADILEDLSEALFEASVLPYYLHLLDPVKGAAHFDVTKNEAKVIMAELIKRLPGFLVPKLVREIAGQPGKTPIDLGLEP